MMLDIEIVTDATDEATDVVSVAELGRHIRLSPRVAATDLWTELLTNAIEDSVAKLEGIGGELNRSVLKRTLKRYMRRFPGMDECGRPKPILLPYPPVISVSAITIENGDSPPDSLSTSDYVVQKGMLVPEIHPVSSWPSVDEGPRAVSVTYTAGYENDSYPPQFKRMVKLLSAHYLENSEATILEMSKTLIDRKTLFAMDDLRASLKISNSYGDWNE